MYKTEVASTTFLSHNILCCRVYPKMHIHLESVGGNKAFADIIKIRYSHTGFEDSNPVTGVSSQQERNLEKQRKEAQVKMKSDKSYTDCQPSTDAIKRQGGILSKGPQRVWPC